MRKSTRFYYLIIIIAAVTFCATNGFAEKNNRIVHDAEYYIIEAQNGKAWAVEDGKLDKKLAELRKKYGAPPNIIH